jgi:CxxC-x17-CxxC domain-containing protein
VNPNNQDRELTCKECGSQFVFTAGEQEFYASRGFEHLPGRCPRCRAARKSRQPDSEPGTGGPYSGSPRRVAREMHPAVCSACGKATEVSFVPRSDKPVYCSDCFAQVRGRQA